MTRYRKSDGTTFVLAHYSAAEWAEVMEAALVRLGCSEKYAAAVARGYREAVTA